MTSVYDTLIPAPMPASGDAFRWGTVTGIEPLTVILDNDTEPMLLTPSALVGPGELAPGNRVWVQLYERKVIVLGAGQGGSRHSTWYPNLQPDPGVERNDYAPVDVSSDWSQFPDQYRINFTELGASGVVGATFDTATKHGGEQSLRLVTSTAGAPSNSINALSPNFTVEPGATYVASCWALKSVAGPSRCYVRLAGGSDDHLSEYIASNSGNALPAFVAFEDQNLTQNVWTQAVLLVTIPAGVTRASFRVWNYRPTTSVALYFDDFEVHKVENHPMSDTGWIPLKTLNSWVDYGPPYPPAAFRKIGNIVYVRGLLKNGVVTAQTPMAQLPPGFRPLWSQMSVVVTSPGTTTGRVDVLADGNINTMAGGVASWTSIECKPFPADQ